MTAPLRPAGPCSWRSEVKLPERGRWFLYAELRRRGRALETWLPLELGERAQASAARRPLYIPKRRQGSATKVVSGLLVYGGLALLLAFIGRTFRLAAEHRRSMHTVS